MGNRASEIRQSVLEVLSRGPEEGLTGPQIHSASRGSWEEVKSALSELVESEEVLTAGTQFSDENYGGYQLAANL